MFGSGMTGGGGLGGRIARPAGSVPGTIMGRGGATWAALQSPKVGQQFGNALSRTAGVPVQRPQAPAHPAAPPVSHPAAPAPAPAPAPGQPPGPPLDATYDQNVAANQFKTNNAINQLNLAGQRDQTALASTLAQLAYRQPRDQLRLEEGANNRGALYSSVYDQNLGDLNYQYLGRQGAAQANYANQLDDIAAKIAAAQGGEQQYEADQAAASAARAANLAAKDPSIGEGTGGLSIPGIVPQHPAIVPQHPAAPAHPSVGRSAHPALKPVGSVPGTIMGRGGATWGALANPRVAQQYEHALMRTAHPAPHPAAKTLARKVARR